MRKLKEEIDEKPGSHTQGELDQAEAKLKAFWADVKAEEAKSAKPDNTNELFADFWDRPNIYGLTSAHALFCLYIPTFVSFGFVLCLQFGFIFYIQEVVRGQRQEAVDKWKTVVCYGDRWGPQWDSQNPTVLRIVCLLTFMTEVISGALVSIRKSSEGANRA